MISAEMLQHKLCEDPELIVDVLEHLGYSPYDKGNYFHFANLDGDNKSACVIWKDNLRYKNYTRANRDGNLFTLVMHDKNCSFPDALTYISDWTGIKAVKQHEIKLPFGGFYKRICIKNSGYDEVETYPDSEFEPYAKRYNKKFFVDGVDYQTQEIFNLGYSPDDNAILIPLYTVSGQLCGIKARNNDPNCSMSQRWWAFKSFNKGHILYGWHINYSQIVSKKTVVLVEAEKSVMQAYSFGFKNCLATLGCNIMDKQIKLLNLLGVERVIIAFDEGLQESDLLAQALKIRDKTDGIKIGYIFDNDNSILSKGTKDSPTDVGKKGFKDLLKTHIVWCDGGEEDEEDKDEID